jgi:hypothetical protein
MPTLQVKMTAEARYYSHVVPGTGTILASPGHACVVLLRAVTTSAHRVSVN